MKLTRTFTFVLLVLALSLTACGLDEYADAANTALGNFNSAGTAVSEQLFMINDDNAIINDPDWQEATFSALDEMEAAGKAFASLPETPAGYEQVDSLLTDLAFETNSFVDITRNMIETGDLNQMDAVNESLTTVNDLVVEVDSAITAANE
jgi:archaellum component FlaG (FlaF/FlaG flagellin family)